ncbi:hypothetical protein ACOSQ4_004413 [Xanthoceras sorbifolium]
MDSQSRDMRVLEEIERDNFLLSVVPQDPIPLNIDFSHARYCRRRQGRDYMGASFFQKIIEGSVVLCQRRLGTLGSCRQRKILSRGVCSSFFYKARYSFFLSAYLPWVQTTVDSDGEDLEEEPLIRHSSLKSKGKATLEDEKLPDPAVAGDDEIAADPSSEKGIGTFAHPVGGVNDPGPSEP